MDYGIIYIKACPSGGDWIKHCRILSSTPESFHQNVSDINLKFQSLSNDINSKYSNDIIIPMDISSTQSTHSLCTTTTERVEEIANDIYNQFLKLAGSQGIPNSIRCVYSVGSDEVMVNLVKYLDSSGKSGLFKI